MSAYKPVDPTLPDPRPRLNKDGLVNITVKPEVQKFFAQMMNHIGKRSDWFATCITCIHWEENNGANSGRCRKFDCVPPSRVIADGCSEYEDEDSIPF